MVATPVYVPPAQLGTALDSFIKRINDEHGANLSTYADLHTFSVTRMNDFWMSFWDFSGIISSASPTKAVQEDIPIDQFPAFFEDSRLNFAENMLAGGENGVAVIGMNETNSHAPDKYTWSDVKEIVRSYASALEESGLQKGQVVSLIGSNSVRSLSLLLATASLGGIFCSFSTDMGHKALDDRLQLVKPRFLFAESSYTYNGKTHNISEKITACVKTVQAAGISEVFDIHLRNEVNPNCTSFHEFRARDKGTPLKFEQVPFNTPLVVMFSSGTTGTPKGIVHSHGGMVVNSIKENLFHNTLGPGDLHYQYTSIGWTLWNMAIGALFVKATVLLYDGSPFYPTAEIFLERIFKQRITSFGAGPRYYSELQALDIKPRKHAQHLHSIVSTGAVLTTPLAKWLGKAFGPVCQVSMSGGTELCGAFLHGTLSLPSFPGELAVKGLGLDVAVFSSDGTPVPDGESGELVCRKPFPNMPLMLWNDPGRKRYRDSYFSKFPNVWTHGDFIQVNPETKGIWVLGRSDGVLNPSGVRFGSAEIYSILSQAKFNGSITDSLVVGQQRVVPPYTDLAERVVLFIKCTPAASSGTLHPTRKLHDSICSQIAQDLSRRHVPAFIFEVDEIPYNANGKKLEIQVKAVLCKGQDALSKMKLTSEELKQVQSFVKFFKIEDISHIRVPKL